MVMRRALGVLIVLVVALLVAVRPKLLVLILVSMAMGAAMAGGSLAWDHREQLSRWLRSHPWKVVVGLCGVFVVAMALWVAVITRPESRDIAISGVGPDRGVIGVAYTADFRYGGDDKHPAWVTSETLRVPRSRVSQSFRKLSESEKKKLVADGFKYQRLVGDRHDYLYGREGNVPIKSKGILTWNEIPLPEIDSPYFKDRLVPGQGSSMEFEGPKRLVYRTDPGAGPRHPSEIGESVPITLKGFDEVLNSQLSPECRGQACPHVSLELSRAGPGRVWRSGIYAAIRQVTLAGVINWVLGSVSAGGVWLFLRRVGKRFFDRRPQVARAV